MGHEAGNVGPGAGLQPGTAAGFFVLGVPVAPGRVPGKVRVGDVLPVVAQGLAMPQGVVPEETGGDVSQRICAVVGVAADESAEGALQVIADVGLVDPGVSVGAQHPGAIEVVQQGKLPGQGVLVGRHFFSKHHQPRIAIALLHVAKNLIVSAVLLDDVEDVLEQRRLAVAYGHRDRPGVGARPVQAGQAMGQAVVGMHRGRVPGQRNGIGHLEDRDRAEMIVRVLSLFQRPRLGQRTVPLDVGHEQSFAIRRHDDAAGIPAGRNQSLDRALLRQSWPWRVECPGTQADDSHAIVGAVGHVQGAAVGAQSQGIATAAKRQTRLRPAGNCFHYLVGPHIDNGDRVAGSVGDVGETSAATEGQATGVQADLNGLDLFPSLAGLGQDGHGPLVGNSGTRVDSDGGARGDGLGIAGGGRVASPVADVAAPGSDGQDGERSHPDRYHLFDLAVGEVDDLHIVTPR